MVLLAADSLPEEFTQTLSEEQHLAVLEAERHERVAALALALERAETDVLREIAESSQLDVASDLQADHTSLRLLPARLVHEYQILPIAHGAAPTESPVDESEEPLEPGPDTPLHLATAWLPDDVMSDWIRTFTPRPVVWHLAVAERVHQLIVEHFGVGAASLDDGDEDYLAPEAADADGDIDLFFGFDGSQQGLPTVAFQDSGTDLNISPNTSSIGNLFTPTLEAGDALFDSYGGTDLTADINTLMTLIDGTTYNYQQATNLLNGDVGFASKKANTPDADSFVTFAIPFDLLAEAIEEASALDTTGSGGPIASTDFTLSSFIRLIAYTATNNNAINQDLFGVDGIDGAATFEASGAFSPISNVYGVVPEAGTFVQVGAFLWVAAGLYFRRRHHVCRRPAGATLLARIS